MKTRSFATLLFFLISLAIFLNDGLAKENNDISTSKQSGNSVIQPECGPSLAMVWHCRHYQPTSFHLSLGGPILHRQKAAAMNKSRLLNKPTASNKTIVTTSKNGFFTHTYQGFVVHSHALSFLVDPSQVGGPCRHDRPTIEMD
ncbi:hypothetical protein RHSIM_RhsimUnG0011800 [Rhododendron simsii]|uniref:Uncharacterized protein n=1 Tax=Rhododendron simsii TaxID=118357 RepID=A0A834L5R9_RHOSS|nr:hypothetical protein RHSIM_RhsimUnG0011800 [Rhododendron simsii]